LHEGDGDDLGVSQYEIVVVRAALGGQLRMSLQVVIDQHVEFDEAVL
jgi:hypothetical protein